MAAATAQKVSPEDALERVLQMADAERRLRDSPQWRTDLESAIEAHSEAVERLYAELYRLLDERADVGSPVEKLRIPPDPRKELKAQIVAKLKQELPSMVASIIDDF